MLIANFRMPILILQGKRDVQVDPSDARRLADADRTAKLGLFTDVNHALKSVPSKALADNLSTYGDPDLPLLPAVVDQVASFILSNSPTLGSGLEVPAGLGAGHGGDENEYRDKRQ
ncbi:hypothetical protein [Lichenicola sp.]|uniref:hypothetical protein n=1 Tax=Lichenicola sp. TaxID=2804529 RepID=UPI003B00296A